MPGSCRLFGQHPCPMKAREAPIALGARARTAFQRSNSPAAARPDCSNHWEGLEAEGLTRRQDHDHLPAFHLRLALHLGDLRRIGLDPIEQAIAELLVRHLAAAELQGDLDLVALLEK